MEFLAILNAIVLSFLVAEIIRAAFFTKKWSFRFTKGDNPIEHWKKILIIMILFILFFPLVNWLFVTYFSKVLATLGGYQVTLLFILLPATYLWIEKRILSLPWNKRDLIPVGIILIDVLISVLV